MQEDLTVLDGGIVPSVGVHENIPNETYHAWKAASRSHLAMLAEGKSPAHLHYQLQHPIEPTEAMILGTATHDAVLEPDTLDQHVVIGLDLPRRKNVDKEAHAAFAVEHAGKIVLKGDDYEDIMRMREAVYYHEAARDILSLDGNVIEMSGVWVESISSENIGLLCKCRPDLLVPEMSALVDLKTTIHPASAESFERTIQARRYDLQAAFYLQGMESVGFDVNNFVFIAVEKEPPYLVGVYRLDPFVIEEAWEEMRKYIAIVAVCYRTDRWPGWSDQIEDVALPNWAMRRLESNVKRQAIS